MSDLRKAAENILKVLDGEPELLTAWLGRLKESREVLRQALAQHVDAVNMSQECVDETAKCEHEWVGLTDEEILAERHKLDPTAGWTYDHFARSIEAKLKEKNT